jgi:RNA polymerase sigma factor (sigma-70 family)
MYKIPKYDKFEFINLNHLIKMENLLKKLARSYNQTTGLDYDDLFQEANVAYLEALRTYNKDRGALSTHVWYCVSNRLKNYIKKEKEEIGSVPIEECNQIVSTTPFWEKLSKDAILVAEIALNRTSLFLNLRKTRTPGRIRRVMRAEGWDTNRINHALYELKTEFSK